MAPSSELPVTDDGNKFEDLSGVEIKPDENPYDALINACDGDPVSRLLSQVLVRKRKKRKKKKRIVGKRNGERGREGKNLTGPQWPGT